MTKQAQDEDEQDFNQQVGARIRKLREEAGFGPAALAKAVGVSRQSVYLWEKGETGVTPANLVRVAGVLHVSVNDLVPPTDTVVLPTPLVRVHIDTRHPENYELVNHMDGTRWEIVDGKWKTSTR